MRDYARIITKIRETAWLMTPEALDAMLHMMDERLTNGKLSDEELLNRLSDTERSMLFHDGDHTDNTSIAGGIGVLPLYGPIFGKSNLMTEMSGASSLETFSKNLDAMLKDDGIGSIILDVDSPGGSSDMVQEVGDQVRAGRDVKPIYAIANVMAGSAAYWISSQATKLYVTPSGSVGSIGVYSVHEDQSVKDANEGKKFTFVSAGRHKTEGNPHEPLSDEARAYRQEVVDGMYADFISNVAIGRNVSDKQVLDQFGGGRMLRPADALEVGMIDGVRTFDSLVQEIANQPQRVTLRVNGSELAAMVANYNMDKTATSNGFITGTISDGVLSLESKEWEHSEPGTGSPPEPRKDGDGSDDPAIKGGWRRTTPPDQDAVPPVTSTKSTKGGFRMDEFVLDGKNARKLFEALKLEDDPSPDRVVEALKVQFGELDALRNSVSAAEQERIFAETYPQYWEEHRKLMERDHEHTAANFVGAVTQIRKTEGYGLKSTKQQLSIEAQNTLMSAHKKFAQGQGTLEDFEGAIKSVVNGGIVQLGEIGNSGDDDSIVDFNTNDMVGVAGARRLFAEQVAKVQRDNPDMSYTDAMKEAGNKHPDLAEAYKLTMPA